MKSWLLLMMFSVSAGAWELNAGAQASEECSRFTKLVSRLARDLAWEEPKVILIGEFHSTLTPENYRELIKEIIHDRRNTCLAVELSPKKAHQLQGVYLTNAIARPLGMRTIFIDSAVTGMTDEESLSLAGLNKRDEAMANNIRANLHGCRQIVSINGAIHTTHFLDSQHGIATAARKTLADRLDGVAKVLMVTKAAEACGLVHDEK